MTVTPPLTYAAELDRVADDLDALRESGDPLPALHDAINQLKTTAVAADLLATSLTFLGKHPDYELLTVALKCRALAGDLRAVWSPAPREDVDGR